MSDFTEAVESALAQTNQGSPADAGPDDAGQPALNPFEQAANKFFGEGEQQQDKADAPPAAPAPKAEDAPPPAEPVKHKIKADGREIEVTAEELYQLAAAGANYTRKTQELARVRDELAPLQALADRLRTDPAFHARVFGPDMQGQQQAQTAPADPLAAWEADILAKAEQAILQKVAPALAPVQAIQRERVAVEVTQALKSRYGEDGPVIEGMVFQYIQQMPEDIRQATLSRLTASPDAMVNGLAGLYEQMAPYAKQFREAEKAKASASAAPPAAPQAQETRTPRPVAPALESPGVDSPEVASAKAKERAVLLKKIKSGNSARGDLARYFEMAGVAG